MFGWEYEKSKEEGGESEEKYWLIKNAGIKGAITSKREHNQTPTFYIMVESIDDFIAKSQQQGAKVIVNKKEISEGFYATLQDQQKIHLVYGKVKVNNLIQFNISIMNTHNYI